MTSDQGHETDDFIAFVATALKAEVGVLSLESSVGDVPGWDSFAQVNLLMKIEERYRIAFEADDLLSMETLGDILSAIQRLSANAVLPAV